MSKSAFKQSQKANHVSINYSFKKKDEKDVEHQMYNITANKISIV